MHDDVATMVERYIAEQQLQPGERLPPERELAERFDVSRAAVRRGLAQLEAQQRLIRHVGRGTFLAAPNGNHDEQVGPAEILAVRRHLEPAIMPMVVASASSSDLDRIRLCLEQSEAATTFDDFERWDAALHAAIVGATHNRLLDRLYEVVNQTRDLAVWGNLKRRTFSAATRAEYQQQHRAIVDALVNRDAAAASAAMDAHIRQITDNLLSDRSVG